MPTDTHERRAAERITADHPVQLLTKPTGKRFVKGPRGTTPVQAAGKFNPDLHPRGTKGRFRTTLDRIIDGLHKWAAEGGKGDPFEGFDREQLRRAAGRRGLTFPPRVAEKKIRDDLLADLRRDLGDAPGKPDVDKPHAEKPAVHRPEPKKAVSTDRPAGGGRDISESVDYSELQATPSRGDHGDWRMYAIQEQQGFNGEPDKVTPEEFDRAVASGEITQTYRGFKGDTAADFAEAYKSGDNFPGGGVYGAGTYVAVNLADANLGAGRWYPESTSGEVIRVGIRRDAKTVKLKKLVAEQRQFEREHADELAAEDAALDAVKRRMMAEAAHEDTTEGRKKVYDSYEPAMAEAAPMRSVTKDLGRFGALRGYDVIDVREDDEDQPQFVVLNRTATVVERDGPSPTSRAEKVASDPRELDKPEPAPTKAAKKAAPDAVDKPDLEALRKLDDPEAVRDALDLHKVPELQAMLGGAGLKKSGRKRELVDRLVEHVHGGKADSSRKTPDPEQARARQADIDVARPAGNIAAQFAEVERRLLDSEVGRKEFAEGLGERVQNLIAAAREARGTDGKLPDGLDEVEKAAKAGDVDGMRTAIATMAERNGVKLEGKAYDRVKFDRSKHRLLHDDGRTGGQVVVIRPRAVYERDGETIELSPAVVADVPAADHRKGRARIAKTSAAHAEEKAAARKVAPEPPVRTGSGVYEALPIRDSDTLDTATTRKAPSVIAGLLIDEDITVAGVDGGKIRNAVSDYSDNGYEHVNGALRLAKGNPAKVSDQAPEGVIAGHYSRERVMDQIEGLDAAMTVSRTTGPVVVYRAVTRGPKGWKDGGGNVGLEWSEDSYVSSSVDARGVAKFGTERMEIHVPEGIGALGIENAQPGLRSEREVLLERGLRFRVVGEKTVGGQQVAVVEVTGRRQGMPAEGNAQVRQADIDHARGFADVAGELDELLNNGADTAVVLRGIDSVGRRGGITSDLAPIRDAIDSGDTTKARALMDDLLKSKGVRQVGKAGDSAHFDRATHEAMPGTRLRDGAAVAVVRPGFVLTRDGEDIRLSKALVEEVDTPAKAAPRKRTPAKTAAPKTPDGPGAKPVSVHDLFKAETSDEAIEAALRDVFEGSFGPYTTKAQVKVRRAGTRVDKRGREHVVEPSISIDGKIYDEQGNEIGNFGRAISPVEMDYADGTVRREVWAEHHVVQLGGGDYAEDPTKYHGTGFGGEFNRRAIEWYRASGVHGIHQNDQNGYVWASQGFDFSGGVMPEYKAEQLRRLIADLRAGKTKNQYDETIPKELREAPNLDAQIAAAEELLTRLGSTQPGQPGYPTAYEVSQLGRRPGQRGKTETWLGKFLKVSADQMILNPDEGEVISQ